MNIYAHIYNYQISKLLWSWSVALVSEPVALIGLESPDFAMCIAGCTISA